MDKHMKHIFGNMMGPHVLYNYGDKNSEHPYLNEEVEPDGEGSYYDSESVGSYDKEID